MLQRMRALLERRAQPLPDRYRRPLLAIATVALIVAMAWAWNRAGLTVDDLSWKPLVALALIAAPASLLLKAAEFIVAARIAGQRPGPRLAMETAVVSSAAHLLPLPGSLLVSVKALADGGAGYGGAVAARPCRCRMARHYRNDRWRGARRRRCHGSRSDRAAGGWIALVGAGAIFLNRPQQRTATLVLAILLVETGWLAVSGFRFPRCGGDRR